MAYFYDCVCGTSFDALASSRCPNCKDWMPYDKKRRHVKTGKVTKHICDSKCTNAYGQTCNCACGGKNHGVRTLRIAL